MEAMMPPARITNSQEAYLDAMGIDVWRRRDTDSVTDPEPRSAPLLKLGPGSGGVLMVCAEDADSATRLANDINRALGSVPVWAWPHANTGGVELIDAVEENLFTTVAVFGQALAAQLFGADLPGNLNSAKVVVLPDMQDILGQGGTRQTLWSTLCRSGMVSAQEHNA